MADKCCSSGWNLACCSDTRGDGDEEALAPRPMAQTQLQKPNSEHVPMPEEDDIGNADQAKGFTLESGPQGMQISGSTSSIGMTYSVNFDSSLSQQIGLEFEILDSKTCLVSRISDEGQAGLWNKDAAPRQRVKRYDCLRLVNGVGNNSNAKELVNMVAACRGPVELTFERPTTLELDVIRNGCKLGLAVAASKSDLGLLVRGIDHDGTIRKINHLNQTDYIIAGDRIVQINGAFLPPGSIAKELAGNEYQLTLYRYLPPGKP